MIIDRILSKTAEDHSKTLQEKVFTVIPFAGIGTIFLMIFIGVFVEDDIRNTIMLGACFLIFLVVVLLSLKTKNVQRGATIIAFVLVVILLPITFIFGGSISGGAPIWFVFGFAYTGMTVSGRRKFVLIGLGSVTTAISYYVAYAYPDFVAAHTIEAAYFDSLSSVLIVSVLLVLMILFENRVYMSETRLIEQQKKEIEELSHTRNLFFSSVSHELRTPLDSIMGFDEIILNEQCSAAVRESAENIDSAGKILLSLINDVLDVSMLEAGRMEIKPVEYETLGMLSDAINMLYGSAEEKGLSFITDIDPDLPARLVGDDVRVQQIIINLLNNAVKYTEEGSVTLSVRVSEKFGSRADVVFTIEDTGIGIRRGEIASIFDEYKRVGSEENRGVEGLGLGLMIVKQLTEEMHGEIQVNSIYTKGTTISVTLPQEIATDTSVGEVSLDDIRGYKENHVFISHFEAPGARVLVVDDDAMNRAVTVGLLKYTHVRIDQAASGAECLEKCADQEYNCIFMDQVMEGMDGTECLRQIRQQFGGMNRETPVVVVTAYSTAEDQTRFRMAGFDGYLLKPVNGEMLENTLLRILPAEMIHRKGMGASQTAASDNSVKHKDKLPIVITTESIGDLPKEVSEKLGVPVIPLIIRNRYGSFIDGVEIETDGVLEYIAERGMDDLYAEPPSISDYEDFFAEHLSDADNIIHISLSGKSGKAYHIAREAASAFDNVHIVDSESLSAGMGLLTMKAVEMAQSGMGVQECLDNLDRIKKRINTSFLVGSTDYLIKIGRIKPQVAALSRLFLLKTSIRFKDGKGGPDRLYMGTTETARYKYIKRQLGGKRRINTERLFIVYAGLTPTELDDVKRWIGDILVFDEVIVKKESASVAAVHGQGTVGLLFMYDED